MRLLAGETIVVAHHTPDLYGSDLQLLESVTGLVDAGAHVIATVPFDGPLVQRLRDRGADVLFVDVPALRKASLSPRGLLRLAIDSITGLRRAVGLLRRTRPAALYVNTMIIPVWHVAGRLARVPTLAHVHEAQTDAPRPVRVALAAPLLLASLVIVNSQAARAALADSIGSLGARARVVYNGVGGPARPRAVRGRGPGDALHLAVVGRISPRKGTDVAVETAIELRRRGHDVRLKVYGSTFDGYEWFETQLRDRIMQAGASGGVELMGYVSPTWPALHQADIVLVPSRTEPFGNTAVEALMARRPVVASSVEGLSEIVTDGRTGLLVPPDDVAALVRAVDRLRVDAGFARDLAEAGRVEAEERFTVERFRDDIAGHIRAIATHGQSSS